MCQTMKFRRTKGKRTKPNSIKSAADAICPDIAVSGPNGIPHLGTLCHWIHNPIEVTEAVCQILQQLMNADPGTVSQKGIERFDWGASPRAVAQKCTQGIYPKTALIWLDHSANLGLVSQKCILTALIWLDQGENTGLVSQKCIRIALIRLDRSANPGLVSRNCIPT